VQRSSSAIPTTVHRLDKWLCLCVMSLSLITFHISGCGSAQHPITAAKESAAPSSSQGETSSSTAPRQGLATSWGEGVRSSVESVSFERDSKYSPDFVIHAYYNDKRGLRAMLDDDHPFKRRVFRILGDNIRFGVTDEEGRHARRVFLPSLMQGADYYVQGSQGSHYGIYVENRSRSRVEVVASVDGLDSMDGRPASFEKPGYILDSGDSMVIRGFRTSMDEVASFKFGSVADSYAELKYGDTRNVGVIGVAIFREKGSAMLQQPGNETKIRKKADPFPGQFATPP